MKDCNYVVNRDEIYVGIVSATKKEKIKIYPDGMWDFTLSTEEDIYQYFDNMRYIFDRQDHICYGNGSVLGYDGFARTMLFVLDENKCANDLLYDSPAYPIFNITEHEMCINDLVSIKNHVYEMKKVLKYFGYSEKLTYDNILEIKERFFGEFILENCELFGRYDTGPNGSSWFTYDALGNHRTFNLSKKDSVFPACYFEMFWNTRSHYNSVVGGIFDRFNPHELEGLIKSLKI